MTTFLYIVRCSDGVLYTGTTRGSLERRIAEHNDGPYGGFTSLRRPVELVYFEEFANPLDAVASERRIKNWSRAKNIESLIAADYGKLRTLSRKTFKAQYCEWREPGEVGSLDTRPSGRYSG